MSDINLVGGGVLHATEPQKAINIFNLSNALELLPKAERLQARGILTEAEYLEIKDALLYVNA